MSFKRILALVLALTMCFSIVFPGGVAFAEEGDDVNVIVNENSETITETPTENTEEPAAGGDTTPTEPETPATPAAEEEEEEEPEEIELPSANLSLNANALSITPTANTQGDRGSVKPVAEIDYISFSSGEPDEGWSEDFTSLVDAIAAAGAQNHIDSANSSIVGNLSTTIRLLKNASLSSSVSTDKAIVLQLNNYKLTVPADFAITGTGSITISGKGTYEGRIDDFKFADGYYPENGEVIPGYRFTVSFNLAGGNIDGATVVESQTVKQGLRANDPGALVTPTRTGYDFAGWSDGAKIWDFTDGIFENKTMTAQWTAHPYTVVLDADGGTLAEDATPISATYDEDVVLPTPTKANSVFKGWKLGETTITTDDAGKVSTLNALYTVKNGSITLTAQWADAAAKIDDVYYETLQEAVNVGGTVTLLKDVTENITVASGTTVVLDLNGKTITSNAADAVVVEGNLTVKNGTITHSGSDDVFWVKPDGALTIASGTYSTSGACAVYNRDGSLTMTGGSVSASADNTPAIYLVGTATGAISGGTVTGHDWGVVPCDTSTLTVSGTAVIGTDANEGYAISTNGNGGQNATVNIQGGTITGAELGVYAPSGSLTISGGKISGATGVYFKSNKLTITGGTITGNGDAAAYSFNGNGANPTGDALVIDSCGYPNGIAENGVVVSGGTFNSTNGKGVVSYTKQDDQTYTGAACVKVENFVSGGTFKGELPAAYCAEGFIPKDNGGGIYGVQAGAKITFMNGETVMQTLAVAEGGEVAYSGEALTKASDSTGEYTFIGWNTDPAATVALELPLPVATTTDVTYSAVFSCNKYVASIGTGENVRYYHSVADAVAEAQSGDVVNVFAGTHEIPATTVIPAGVTLKGAGNTQTTLVITTTNSDGLKITKANVTIKDMTIDGRNINSGNFNSLINVKADGCLIDNVIMTGGGQGTWNSSILVESLTSAATFTVSNSTISGSFRGVLRESCSANIVITNCDIDAVYPFNIDGGDGGTVTVTGGALHGWTSYSHVGKVTFTNVEFSKGNSGYDNVAAYVDTAFENCAFDKDYEIYAQIAGFAFELTNCTKENAEGDPVSVTWDNFQELFPEDPNVWTECTTTVYDPATRQAVDVTSIVQNSSTGTYYTTLNAAVEAAGEDALLVMVAAPSGDTGTAALAIGQTVRIKANGNAITVNAPANYKLVETGPDADGVTTYSSYAAAAKIGDNLYDTLEDAFAAAVDGNTITVLKNCSGNGIVVPQGKFATGLTVDFGGFTYTLDGNPVGSAGTEYIGFQLLKGNKLTFQNGGIAVAEETTGTRKFLRVFQSYADVTFTGMTIDGTKLVGDNAATEFCNGTVSISGNTSITSKENVPAVNVDAWNGMYPDGAHLTVNTTGTITGIHNYTEGSGTAAASDLYIAAGTISGTGLTVAEGNTVAVTKAEAATVAAPEGYMWSEAVSGVQTLVTVVAMIDETPYASLADALNAAREAAAGGWNTTSVTVEIISDITFKESDAWTPIVFNQLNPITINGNNHAITNLPGSLYAKSGSGTSSLTMTNLTFVNPKVTSAYSDSAAVIMPYADSVEALTFTNVKIQGAVINTNANWTGAFVGFAAGYSNVNDGPVYQHITFNNCSVTGSTITGNGSTGGLMGHASGSTDSRIVVTGTTVSGNTVTCAEAGKTNKAGALFGTVGALGPTNKNDAGLFVDATVSGNTVTSDGTVITTIYGRQGTDTGVLTMNAGGSYDNPPIETDVAWAQPAEGCILPTTPNSQGVYSVIPGATIGFVNYDEVAVLQAAADYAEGAEVAYSGATPTRPADANGVYTFDGWTVKGDTSETPTVYTAATLPNAGTTDITYVAHYSSVTSVASVTIGEDTTYYPSLAAAVEAVPANGTATITMLANETLSTYVSFPAGKTITLDLAGRTVERGADTGGSCALDVAGTLKLVDSGRTEGEKTVYGSVKGGVPVWVDDGGAFTLTSGLVDAGESGVGIIAEGDNTVIINGGEVKGNYVISAGDESKVTVNSGKLTGVGAGNTGIYAHNDAQITITGGEITAHDYAISTNGSASGEDESKDVKVTISGGKLTSTHDIAVYIPAGDFTISDDAVITGKTAVYYKAGSLSITGGTLTGSGIKAGYAYSGNGCNATGDALVIDNCNYPQTISAPTITGGTFVSANAQPIASYVKQDDPDETAQCDRVENFVSAVKDPDTGEIISAPSFNKQLPLEYCADGFAPSEKIGDSYTVVLGTAVAMIETAGDTKYFATLADAIDAVPTDGTPTTITMIADETIVGNTGVTIAATQNVVLDLNGQTIRQTGPMAGASYLIKNNGTLTVKDSTDTAKNGTGNGKMYCTAENPDTGDIPTYATNMFSNYGTLTIESGYYEQLTNAGYASFVVDNYSGATANITGGKLCSNAPSAYVVRMFCNSTSNPSSVNISGGIISGGYALWLQTPNANACAAELNITGGEFVASDGAPLYVGGTKSDHGNISIDIKGGTFTTEVEGDNAVALQGAKDNTSGFEKLSISGGVYNGKITTGAGIESFISGGTFVGSAPDEKYIVPSKVATLYDETTHTYVIADAVARIGNAETGIGYLTLEAAFAAAEDGDTITLLDDASGNGIVVPEGKFTTGLTVDFGGFTYTLSGDPVGSSGTEYIGFQLLKGNKLSFQNGGIAVAEETTGTRKFLRVFQSYADVTFTDMAIDGTKLVGNNAATEFCNGTVTIGGNTSITSKENVPAVNVDAWNGAYPDGAHLTVNTTGTITGIHNYTEGSGTAAASDLYIEAGTISGTGLTVAEGNTVTVTKAGTASVAAPAGFLWSEAAGGVQTLVKAVAMIGDVGYATLADAIAAVLTDGTETTITMIADETIEVTGYALTIPASKNVVLDLNGHQVVGQCSSSGTSALIRNLGTLTINDSSDLSTGKLIGGADPTWTWDGTDDYSGSYASNLICNEGTLVVNGGTLSNVSSGSAAYAIDNYGSGKVTVNGGTIDAAKASAIRLFTNNGGGITVNDGNIGHYKSGSDCSYMGIQVMSGTNADVEINGGTVDGSYSVYSNGTGDSSVTISGGTFPGDVAFGSAGPNTISISGGTFESWVGTWGSQTGFISGGTFHGEPDPEYIAPTKAATVYDPVTDTYIITDATAQVTHDGVTVGYLTLAAAVAAATDGDTVKLLADVALTATQDISKNLTIDLNGKNITATGTRALWVKSGTVEITGTGTISATGDSLNADSSVIRVGDGAANTNAAKLTIGSGVTVSSDKSYGVTVFGKNTVDASGYGQYLTVNGTISVSGDRAAISTNGNTGYTTAKITVASGAQVKNTSTETAIGSEALGIYLPAGDLVVTGGEIVGPTAVYIKGGTADISGATITGTQSPAKEYSYYGNGGRNTGDAIVVDSCQYPTAPAAVTIGANTITSTAGKDVGYYVYGQSTKATVTSTSNSLTIPDGFAWIKTGNVYKITTAKAYIDHTEGSVTTRFYYATLKDAIDAALTGETVVITADLPLGGATTVTGKTVTVIGNGVVQADGDINDSIYVYNGTLNLGSSTTTDNFTIDGGNTHHGDGLFEIQAGGAVNMYDGVTINSMPSSARIATIILSGDGSSFHMYGGKVIGKQGSGSALYSAIAVEDGNGTITIEDGEIGYCMYYSVYVGGTGTFIMNGGTVTGTPDYPNCAIIAGTYGAVYVTDGQIAGHVQPASPAAYQGIMQLSGGIYSNYVNPKYWKTGHILTNNTDTHTKDDYPYTFTPGAIIKFVNYNGSTLATLAFAAGETVVYEGTVTPVKPNTASEVFTWYGWSDGENEYAKDATLPAATTTNVTYTAVFTSAATVASITKGDPAETTYYATVQEAVAAAADGDTVILLKDLKADDGTALTARVDVDPGAGNAITIDLGGKTIACKHTSGNGSAFNIKSGTVTIKNGTIDGTGVVEVAGDTTSSAVGVNDGICLVTVRSGATLNLTASENEPLYMVVNSKNGSCVYPFAGGTVNISGGTYENQTTEAYQYKAGFKGMTVNQANVSDRLVNITGGMFIGNDPQLGDDSNGARFVTAGYVAMPQGSTVATQNGTYNVVEGGRVIFDTDDGTPVPAEQRIAKGGKVTKPADPTKENFEFTAWNNGNVEWKFDTDTVTTDVTLTAQWATAVASVKHGENYSYYATVQGAVNAAAAGDTVTILADDLNFAQRVDVEKSMTINLNGKTLYGASTAANGSIFNIKSGEVTIENGKLDGTQVVEVAEKNADHAVKIADGICLVTVRNGATLNLVDGVNMVVNSKNGCCVYPFAGGTVNISGGTYENKTTEDYQYKAGFKGLTVNQANDQDQLIFITGGTFKGNDPQLGDDSNGARAVKLGYVAMPQGSTVATQNGTYNVVEGGVVTFDTDGGTPETIAEQRIAKGGKVTKPDDPTKENFAFAGWKNGDAVWDFETSTVTADVTLKAQWSKAVASVFDGTTTSYYATLQGAVDAAEESDLVTLLANTEENVTISDASLLTLDLNGKTLTAKNANTPAILNKGNLSVEGGTIVNTSGVAVENSGALSLTDVNVDAATAIKLDKQNTIQDINVSVDGGTYRMNKLIDEENGINTAYNVSFTNGTFVGGTWQNGAFTKASIDNVGITPIPDTLNSSLTISGGYFSHDFEPSYLAAGKRLTGTTIETWGEMYEVISSTKFRVLVSSEDTTMGTAGTSGAYPEGTLLTVTATPNSGYVFAGWYENGTLVSNSASYTFTVTARRTLVAKFVSGGSPSANVNLTVSASKFKITGFGNDDVERTHLSRDAVIGQNYTLTYCGAETFLYWENGQHRVMSRNESFDFKLATDLEIHAVTSNTGSSKEISFVNYSDQILFADFFSTTSTTANMIPVPAAPVFAGGEFDGWTINGAGLYGSDEVADVLVGMLSSSTDKSFVVKAHYNIPAAPVTITINFVEVSDGKVSKILDSTSATGKVGYNTITLTSEAIPGTLSYWLYGNLAVGESIVGLDKQSTTNSVNVRLISTEEPVTMTVVVNDSSAQQPTAAIQQLDTTMKDGVKMLSCVAVFSVPDDTYSVVEKGILRIAGENNQQYLNLQQYEEHGGKRARSAKTNTDSITYTSRLVTEEDITATWYYCVYLTYTAPNGEVHTIYSGIQSITYPQS